MDTALGFGLRHALHAVRTGLELELGVDVVTLDAGDHFLEATVLALVGRQHLDPPALLLGITRIHAEQVAGEDRRLVATGAGADFQIDVAPVVGVLRQQHALQAVLQLDQRLTGLGDFLLGHLAQVRVAVLEQRLGTFEVGLHLAQLAEGGDYRLDLGIFLGVRPKLALLGDHLGVAEQRREFLETIAEVVQLVQQ